MPVWTLWRQLRRRRCGAQAFHAERPPVRQPLVNTFNPLVSVHYIGMLAVKEIAQVVGGDVDKGFAGGIALPCYVGSDAAALAVEQRLLNRGRFLSHRASLSSATVLSMGCSAQAMPFLF